MKTTMPFIKVVIVMSLIAFLLTGCKTAADQSPVSRQPDYVAAFSELEGKYGARIGVYALDTETNKEVTYRADERFPYCSTFKVLAAAVVLQQDSLEQLKEVVQYSQKDILSYAPITQKHVDKGMTIEEICNAAIRFSDNTAGNLLLDHIGGPSGFKAALTQLGDYVTLPVRIEPDLNEGLPGDNRDTSTPRQLAIDLQAYTTKDLLTADKKNILIGWMTGNATGNTLIRAGAPADWVVADKSGAGSYGTRNDIALVMRPDRKPIIVAILSTHDVKEAKYDDNLIALAAKIVFDSLGHN